MPEPISLAIFTAVLKAASIKTAAAPAVNAAATSTSIAYATGAASTAWGSFLVGVTLTGATMVAIAAIIDKVVKGGYMSGARGRKYAEELEKLPYYKQAKILADLEAKSYSLAETVFNNHGVYAYWTDRFL